MSPFLQDLKTAALRVLPLGLLGNANCSPDGGQRHNRETTLVKQMFRLPLKLFAVADSTSIQ